jgi:hypothetical protein
LIPYSGSGSQQDEGRNGDYKCRTKAPTSSADCAGTRVSKSLNSLPVFKSLLNQNWNPYKIQSN